MKTIGLLPGLLVVVATTVQAADYRAEALPEPPPTEGVSAEIAATLATEGVRVIRGESRPLCDIWLCREWRVESLEPGPDLIYPLTPGQLVGIVRFARKGNDFRDQKIADGIYTLRYSQQPVDGSHVGTSPTRDFFLLLPVSEDTSTAVLEYKPLTELSAKVVGASHPCLLSLQRVQGEELLRHDEERDWWLLRLQGRLVAGSETKELEVDLVVVGKAEG